MFYLKFQSGSYVRHQTRTIENYIRDDLKCLYKHGCKSFNEAKQFDTEKQAKKFADKLNKEYGLNFTIHKI